MVPTAEVVVVVLVPPRVDPETAPAEERSARGDGHTGPRVPDLGSEAEADAIPQPRPDAKTEGEALTGRAGGKESERKGCRRESNS